MTITIKDQIEKAMAMVKEITPEEASELREKQKVLRYQMHLGECNLYPDEKKYKLKNYKVDADNKSAVDKTKEFIDNSGIKTLIITGVMGCGKTHLAIAAAKIISYINECSLDIVRASCIRHDDKKNGSGILIIDDIGREHGTEKEIQYRRGCLASLIEHRYLLGRRQIVTTNLDIHQLADVLSKNIFDRLKSEAIFTKITGPTRRRMYGG